MKYILLAPLLQALIVLVCCCKFDDAWMLNSAAMTTATRRHMTLSSSAGGDACGPCPMAPKCKGDNRKSGCDGTGKIQGGIATVPFLSWWPIKVFRPCPSYLAAGYVYRREGQTMDQVLFREPSTKQKEKWAAKQMEQKAAAQESAVETDKAEAERKAKTDLDPAQKFLEDTFGN